MVETLQPTGLALVILWPSLATVVVALRVYTRISMRQFFLDDYTIVVAWALAVDQATVSYIVSVKTWQGYHVYDIPDFSVDERVVAAKYDIANQLLYNPILALVKASIAFFLWRLEDRRKVIRWSLISFFVLNLALAISTFVADLCQCTPVSYHWNKYRTDTYEDSGNVLVQTGTCINVINFFLITAGLSVLTDILIMIIPAAMVWGLKMNRSKKIVVWAVMSLGWVVFIVGVERIALFITQSRPGNLDPTYSLGFTISGAEVNIAIIASSGPALKAFTVKYTPSFLGISKGATSANVSWSPEGPSRDGVTGRSRHSRAVDKSGSQLGRATDAQYGMSILKTSRYDVETSSQEAIVSKEIDRSRSESEFGSQDGSKTTGVVSPNRQGSR